MLTGLRSRLTPRTLALQLGGNALLALLFVAWLQIPDSHIWQLALSLLIIAAMAGAFLTLHVRTLRAIREPAEASSIPRLWLRALLLAAWIVLFYLLATLIQHVFGETPSMTRAGYWNSRFPAHLRNFFTYDHLYHWQLSFGHILLWWVLPTLLLPLMIESIARAFSTLREPATRRIYRRWQLWLSTAGCAWLACYATAKLVGWQPGHSVHGELISLVLRFAAVYGIDVLLYCVVAAVLSALLAREHAGGNTPA